MPTRPDAAPATSPLPRLAILLVAGAAVHLVILVATRTAMNVYVLWLAGLGCVALGFFTARISLRGEP